MDSSQLFEIWAPPESVWSRWAKPVLFADPRLAFGDQAPPAVPAAPPASAPRPRGWGDPATAFVLDLPGSWSVELGLDLARTGYRPVPLFNGADHPFALVDVRPVYNLLVVGAQELATVSLAPEAPPAFLLDVNRQPSAPPPLAPGKFDNRWVVFPQDFPSATFLRSRGVLRVMLLQEKRLGEQPRPDLAHVLRRWQEAGIEIYRQDPAADEPPRPLNVERPSRFRGLLYRALALAGLRRNSAGGFGSVIPQPSSGGGGGGFGLG
jgi:hypothetical protein